MTARVGGADDGPHDEPFDEFPEEPLDELIDLPIDGTLDLHTFHPRDAKDLVVEYVAACRARGIRDVRIIHGKGTGALRETVHAALARLPEVESFRLASDGGGNWGATEGRLRA